MTTNIRLHLELARAGRQELQKAGYPNDEHPLLQQMQEDQQRLVDCLDTVQAVRQRLRDAVFTEPVSTKATACPGRSDNSKS
jgi:hypothetical protein